MQFFCAGINSFETWHLETWLLSTFHLRKITYTSLWNRTRTFGTWRSHGPLEQPKNQLHRIIPPRWLVGDPSESSMDGSHGGPRWRFTPRELHLFSMWCGGSELDRSIRDRNRLNRNRETTDMFFVFFSSGCLGVQTIWKVLKWLWKGFWSGTFSYIWTESLLFNFMCVDFSCSASQKVNGKLQVNLKWHAPGGPWKLENWKIWRYRSFRKWLRTVYNFIFFWMVTKKGSDPKMFGNCMMDDQSRHTRDSSLLLVTGDQAERLLDSEFPCVGVSHHGEGKGEIAAVLSIWIWMRWKKWNDRWRCAKLFPNMIHEICWDLKSG